MAKDIATHYSPSALVSSRGREWVVLPEDEPGVVRLRPIDGLDHDIVGLLGRAIEWRQWV